MKKSTIIQLLLLIYASQIGLVTYLYNKTYHFLPFDFKVSYGLVSNIGILVTLAFFVLYGLNRPDSKKDLRKHYLNFYGKEKYNFMYTYHYILFGILFFQVDSYIMFSVNILLFILTNVIRTNQNNYADEYHLEELAEQAKETPKVTIG